MTTWVAYHIHLAFVKITHLPRRCGHANLTFVCAKLPGTVSGLRVWQLQHSREEKQHSRQLPTQTGAGEKLQETPRNDWVEFSYSKRGAFTSLGLFGDAGAHQPPAAMGSLEELCGQVQPSCCLRKACLEGFGARVTHFHVLSIFTDCLLGPFSTPSASIPPGAMSVLCPAA